MAIFDLPGSNIFMHNRAGLRIEITVGDQETRITLWASPLAGKSDDIFYRNFSNRDDHTAIFDRIVLPKLTLANFVKCDWDPFYSKIVFQSQVVHVLAHCTLPAITLWCEQPAMVDFKTDKADTARTRNATTLAVEHPDRGEIFSFFALLQPDTGSVFHHQLTLDRGRSTYARASLAPNATLTAGGELAQENLIQTCSALAQKPSAALLRENEAQIASFLQYGRIRLAQDSQTEQFTALAARTILAMTDLHGAIRASIARIYYLLWHRDGAVAHVFQANSGNPLSLYQWARFELANPTVITSEQPQGRTFLQLIGPITKWEEDGVFFAVLSAFSAWTQSGDRAFVTGENRSVLNDAVAWLETHCFDRTRHLFGRYYRCEDAFQGTRDFGYDNAVGIVAVDPAATGARWEGKLVRRSYDIYINLCMYSVYCMLAATEDAPAAGAWTAKAAGLAEAMRPFFAGHTPDYGDLLCDDDQLHRAGPYGLDREDYLWGQTLPPFPPFPQQILDSRQALLDDLLSGRQQDYFLASYFGLLQACDPLWHPEAELYAAIRKGIAQSFESGTSMPMPGAMLEMLNRKEGDPYHYIRPQGFSIGPYLAAVSGLGVRRLPFGLAVRPSRVLQQIERYQYQQAEIDFRFQDGPAGHPLCVNQRPLQHTLQIPERWLQRGANQVTIYSGYVATAAPVLADSTVSLLDYAQQDNACTLTLRAFGCNQLTFTGTLGLCELAQNGKPMAITQTQWKHLTIVQFDGRGEFTLRLSTPGA